MRVYYIHFVFVHRRVVTLSPLYVNSYMPMESVTHRYPVHYVDDTYCTPVGLLDIELVIELMNLPELGIPTQLACIGPHILVPTKRPDVAQDKWPERDAM